MRPWRLILLSFWLLPAGLAAAATVPAAVPEPPPAEVQPADLAQETVALGEKAVTTSQSSFRAFFAALWSAVKRAFGLLGQIFGEVGGGLKPREATLAPEVPVRGGLEADRPAPVKNP